MRTSSAKSSRRSRGGLFLAIHLPTRSDFWSLQSLIETTQNHRRAGYGRETGIRTLGTLAGTTDFESVPFDHSGTSPQMKFAFR